MLCYANAYQKDLHQILHHQSLSLQNTTQFLYDLFE